MARGQRDPALERRWRERVARWSTSGLSVRAFCRQHGLVEASFYYWKRELRGRDATLSPDVVTEPRKSASWPKSPPVFVPVTVLPGSTLAVEVRCPSGHVVLLPACDVASLTSVLTALTPPERELPSC